MSHRWQLFLTRIVNGQIEEHFLDDTVRTSPYIWRDLLVRHASIQWGIEGRDWRIVQDGTVIGFHANQLITKNGKTEYGESIEIR